MGDDSGGARPSDCNTYFNPRPPCGRRPVRCTDTCARVDFNPRPPCGRRLRKSACQLSGHLFQPTSPVRETTHDAGVTVVPGIFQPTSPVRETTSAFLPLLRGQAEISTHVPRAGDDGGASYKYLRDQNDFNPRPPCGRRPGRRPATSPPSRNFNPRPPCGRRLPCSLRGLQRQLNFNPRPPCGRRRW